METARETGEALGVNPSAQSTPPESQSRFRPYTQARDWPPGRRLNVIATMVMGMSADSLPPCQYLHPQSPGFTRIK